MLENMDQKSLEDIIEQVGFGRFHYLLVFFCGIILSLDATEIFINAYVQSILKCSWESSAMENSLLASGMFIGMIFGSSILGGLGDVYGRKTIMVMSSFAVAYLEFLCAASPSMLWVIILRTVIGIFIGGKLSFFGVIASEFVPKQNRGNAVMTMLAFMPLGSYIVTILCVLIVQRLGWRAFLAVSALPICISVPLLIWIPESPRLLLLQNKPEEAIKIIKRIATMNGASTDFNLSKPKVIEYSFRDLFHSDYITTSLIVPFLMFVSGLTYYGILLLVTTMHNIPRQCLQDLNRYSSPSTISNSTIDNSCCITFTWSNSVDAIISTTGEVIFLPVALLLINVLGRKYSMAFLYLTIAVLFVLMNLCMPPPLLSILLFLIRGSAAWTWFINILYISEVYPTSVRGLAAGSSNGIGRIGAMISPFIINFVVLKSSFLYGTLILIFLCFLAFIGALLLRYETKDRALLQTAEEFSLLTSEEKRNDF